MQIISNIIFVTCLYFLVAFSFSLIYTTTKLLLLTHAAKILLGGYLFILIQSEINCIASLFSTILITILFGLSCKYFIYKKMQKIGANSFSFLIASLGIYIVVQNFISIVYGNDTKVISLFTQNDSFNLLGAYITKVQLFTIIIAAITFGGLILFSKTKKGRAINAVAQNEELAAIVGINPQRVKYFVFGIGSALAAIAGILAGADTGINPSFGFNLLLYGIVAMIIGGIGNTKGLVLGSLLLASAQNLTAYFLDTKWMDAVTYVTLIAFLIWRPLGFSGKRLKKIEI